MPLSRRTFLQSTAAATSAGLLADCSTTPSHPDPAHPVLLRTYPQNTAPARWAIAHFTDALQTRGLPVRQISLDAPLPPHSFMVSIVPVDYTIAPPTEQLDISNHHGELTIAPSDPRALVYALTDLADRVTHSSNPLEALRTTPDSHESPANRTRSIMRIFTSELEDKPWFHDRDFWQRYLTLLAASRFNRFNLSFGLTYDNNRNLSDTYFYFAYPYLLDVPGYHVRATNLPDEERDLNLASLKFISDECAKRGLHFQLGLWTHAYEALNSPRANHLIEGLTPQTHAPYCRDALRLLLTHCPNINGVTFRVHGESGIPEGSYDLWKTIFSATSNLGRPMQIDMHAKGIDQQMIDTALSAGNPVSISPKFWAEHLGLPYHQADIRELERPRNTPATGQFALSNGARSFLRYGYGDLLTNDRKYGILYRIWPGTQRFLLWADPAFAADYGRCLSFGNADGFELFDPLSFKGRQGSGLPGHRTAYADDSLQPQYDHEKFALTYRLWGRLTYNPDTPKEVWQRQYQTDFGPAAGAIETALASASRILPLFTTAHLPSGANLTYWPEIYTSLSLVDPSKSGPFTDTPAPRTFLNVSPIDPQLFSTVNEHVASLLAGQPSAKISPAEVAAQLDAWADAADAPLAKLPASDSPALRRATLDAKILALTGRFFAAKLRAALLFALHQKTSHPPAKDAALAHYKAARTAWNTLANLAAAPYVPDISFGPTPWLRGHWSDRLPAIDADLLAVQAYNAPPPDTSTPHPALDPLMTLLTNPPAHPTLRVNHTPPTSFRPGDAVILGAVPSRINTPITLRYRHINHGDRWQSIPMNRSMSPNDPITQTATIPADYTKSPFALQYYFELHPTPDGPPQLHPGFTPNYRGQPYFVIPQA